MKKDIMVSICCMTYNHENYIRQCLDGFLMQQTSFSIEIIVHDDASTDNTPNILREYEKKYPELFHVIYQNENQYSKKEVSIFLDYMFPLMKGKYIAFCEGDDYWINPLKLQKQVDFLESHPDYSMCCHHLDKYIQSKGVLCKYNIPKEIDNKNVSFGFQGWVDWGSFFQTSSVVCKANCIDIGFLRSTGSLDVHFYYSLLKHGKGYFMSDAMSVYRVHNKGVWSGISSEKQKLMSLEVANSIYRIEKNSTTKKWMIINCGELILFYIRREKKLGKAIKSLPKIIDYLGFKNMWNVFLYIGKKMVHRYFK